MMTAAQIRKTFLEFFQAKMHEIVPSAPIVVKNDPTLMFTNAGMNQFKDYFLGNKQPDSQRMADTQKCLRVSGKHNDLEEVGRDTYHHTMFEMLGNWSFGDYFKPEAIGWAWELLTEVYRIPVDRLYVTVFGGDENDGLPLDEEASRCWETHIAKDRILKGNKKDNFWEMGETGPCGPCSEIHIDCRSDDERRKTDGRDLVNAGDPQVIEIWNLVFMEFNRLNDGSLKHLPARHVDTGMGFERLVRVLQEKSSNYDTDLFAPVISATEKLAKATYGGADSESDIAFRVIADHIRAISFTISDGQLPSNTGAGYVIRRILRRAVRYYFSFLHVREPLLYRLTGVLADQFAGVFPELSEQREFVEKVIREEEEAFLRTLDKGLKRLDDMIGTDEAAPQNKRIISGKDAFELLDTFGFPEDLTRLIAGERGISVDEDGFRNEMQQQKKRSRAAMAIDAGDWIEVNPGGGTTFVGYDDLLIDTRVVKYRKVKTKNKQQYQLVLERTPFYPESGGQVGDTGTLEIAGHALRVTDTRRENGLIIHFTEAVAEDMTGTVTARVDFENRLHTAYNHTATHLLHAALKQVVGTHVNQKGSLVTPEVLRFDVSHFTKFTEEELRQVELLVNEKIRENIQVITREMPRADAMKLGAMALFGEKYGEVVRVVEIDPRFSIELCGGTHVQRTGMIGLFALLSESAVAAGVRRIEALTGGAAIRYASDKIAQNKQLTELLKTQDPIKAIEKLLDDKSLLEKQVESLQARELARTAKALAAGAQDRDGIAFVGAVVEADRADQLKQICFQMKPQFTRYLFVLAADVHGKAAVALMCDEQTRQERNLDATRLIKEKVAPLIKGGGGGQPTFATAGGTDPAHLMQVIETVKVLV